MIFYDTNALLHCFKKEINNSFMISNLSFVELENIKNNTFKDNDIKSKARQLINWLIQNQDNYTVIPYDKYWDNALKGQPLLLDNVDSRIIFTALKVKEQIEPDIIFCTYDLNCYKIAKEIGLNCIYPFEKNDNYTGYKIMTCKDENELVDFYSSFSDKNSNILNLLPNEYVLFETKNHDVIDIQKYLGKGKGYSAISELPIISKMFGKTKPKDAFQQMAIDSLNHNQITVLRGPAGTGKSLLAMSYLFQRLQKGKIDKIIIFCNTVATDGSAKLG